MALLEPVAVWEVLGEDGDPGVRFLVGEIDPASAPILQERSPPLGPGGCLPALVPDDQGALASFLARVPAGAPRWERQGTRAFSLSAGEARLAAELLEHEPIRALQEPGPRRSVLAAVAALAEPGLRLAPIHRGLARPHLDVARFLAVVADYARIYELEAPLTTRRGLGSAVERLGALASGHHALLLVHGAGEGKILRFRQGLGLEQIKAAPRNPTLRSLDLALLNALVFRTVLGVGDPDPSPAGEVRPVEALEALVAQVVAGELQLGFGLNPPPRWEVRALIEARQTLPPQTMRVSPLPSPALSP